MLVEKNIEEEPGTRKEIYISEAGFTLVELMVVLAVMGVLIMILLPPLQRARDRARSTACQNNLRQYGIATGRYMSDWKGYFVYPGEAKNQGGATYYKDSSGAAINPDDFNEGMYGRGGVAASSVHNWHDLIGYLPAMPTNSAALLSGVSSVRICPSIQQALKNGNYFDPRSSNYFKGFQTVTYDAVDYELADFEDEYNDTDGNLILLSYFTTYAINGCVSGTDRKKISNRTIAFIDWNAKEGWGAIINYTNWMFNTPSGRSPIRTQGTPKCAASNIWWLTEVGFHHKEDTNLCANYVAMDGHVGSVSSNEISRSYFESTGPK